MKAQEQSDYLPCPEGSRVGKWIQAVDLGTQPASDMFKKDDGSPQKPSRQEYWLYEFPGFLMEDGRPWTIGEFVSVSSSGIPNFHSNSKLLKRMKNWIKVPFEKGKENAFGVFYKPPKGFDSMDYLGVYGRINVETKGEKTVVSGVTALEPEDKKPESKTPILRFEIDAPDAMEKFSSLSQFLKNKIIQSPEWQIRVQQGIKQMTKDTEPVDFDAVRSAQRPIQHEDDIPF